MISLLILKRKPKEKGGGRTRSFFATCYVVSLLSLPKRNEDISRGEDPELSGVISSLVSIRNLKEKGREEDSELSRVNALMFFSEATLREREGGRSGRAVS